MSRSFDSEATLDLYAALSHAGQELLEAAGALRMSRTEDRPPEPWVTADIRRYLQQAGDALAAYDRQRAIAKGRKAMEVV